MISRTIFLFRLQASVMRFGADPADPSHLAQTGQVSASMMSNTFSPNALTIFLA